MNNMNRLHKLIGDDMQIVEVELDPGETVIAEAGAMNYMEDNITFEAKWETVPNLIKDYSVNC